MNSIKDRREKSILEARQRELAENISAVLKAGGQVEFGSNAIISNGNFSKVLRIDFSKAGEETEFPFSRDGIVEALKVIGWAND